jgi:hypothetical protein
MYTIVWMESCVQQFILYDTSGVHFSLIDQINATSHEIFPITTPKQKTAAL